MMASQASRDLQAVGVSYIFDFSFWKVEQEDITNCKVHKLIAAAHYTKPGNAEGAKNHRFHHLKANH